MATTGRNFAALTRRQVEVELERLSRRGVAQAASLLNLVTEENYAELWPYIEPLLGMAMSAQQDGSNAIMESYFIGIAIAAGFTVARGSRPYLPSEQFTGLLPSGMPWARLMSTVPQAVAHRVENGMPLREALQRSKATVMVAINSQAHADQRRLATAVLTQTERDSQYSPTMQRLLREMRERRESESNVTQVDFEAETERRVADELGPGWRVANTVHPVRYIRQPNAGACSWCLMLATKGAIFRSEDTARSSGHNNCKCQIYPEPVGGAWKGKILADQSLFEGVVWRDTKRGVDYDLAKWAARKKSVMRNAPLAA